MTKLWPFEIYSGSGHGVMGKPELSDDENHELPNLRLFKRFGGGTFGKGAFHLKVNM